MILKDFIRAALEREYLGTHVYNRERTATFLVHKITVEDGGVDPQWEFNLCSKLCEEMNEEQRKWQKENNLHGGNLAPKELEDRWRKGWMESFYMTNADDVMPELVYCEDEDDVGKDTPDLSPCEQCGEHAWDGRICYSCGMKHI